MQEAPTPEQTALRTSSLFGVVAPAIGWVPPLRFLLRRARILRLLAPLGPGKLVEVGCGAGALLHELAAMNTEAVGLETSTRARTTACAIAGLAGGKQRITEQPDADWQGSRDLVCAFDVLEHIEDQHGAVSAWTEWLKPGGRMCISVPAHRSRWSAGDEWAGHWRRYDRQDLVQVMQAHGLVIEHLECYGFPLANLTEWQGNKTYKRLLQERGDAQSKAHATEESGVERGYYLRLFQIIDTLPGRFALRVALAMQSLTASTNWGSGYLVLARKA